MAKKVRFPLEMDNGTEVRSLAELRENFSLSRVIGYVKDGKLITWLRDRYENDLADSISSIDLSTEDAAKKICKALDVEFEGDSEEEIEKARERERKLEILKGYPECSEYSKKVDLIAFDQDDLYDLLDEGVEEIYLCGSYFSVPTARENVRYIGIINDVVVVIDSKKVVNFDKKSISFKNCRFDEKYSSLLVSSENEKPDEKIEAKSTQRTPPIKVDSDEVNEVTNDLMEMLNDYAENEYENEDDELYSYDDSIECDADDYNDSGFSTKAKAKAACKEALNSAISDVKSMYDSSKKELIAATYTYYDGFKENMLDFMKEFFESYEELIKVYCSGETERYLRSKLSEKKKWGDTISKQFDDAFRETVNDHFASMDSKSLSVKDLFEMCDYDEEDDDDYSFNIEEATDSIVCTFADFIQQEEDAFPENLFSKYSAIKTKCVNDLIKWTEEL